MKKKTTKSTKKTTKKTTRAVKKTTAAKVVHGPTHDCPQCRAMYGGDIWGKDRGLVLLLGAGIIVLIVAGMYLAGWL
ncbi:hypothetical protein C5B42_05900 [Candidatus Cerribacteria bacterium 'Amazon FNV 2010 28 9']|uniref:Uncharacterized protein n=1 Tax=Candidatus Cerribacteria bacterium 'Amazon FNV 2010 28 9' TaxID=2081795 RepID=A0A317JLQ6_9BACT|nr:MAG: hypothetical protein C5B42_05900 [Candidatus Cerribacteria bacterium 'Amazon FNV 2010 28 9']